MKWIQVNLNERVVVLQRGLPKRALTPGRHWQWGLGLSELRYDTDALLLNAAPEVRAILPKAWYAEVELGPQERAILYRDQVPQRYLRSGVHRYWVVDGSVSLRRWSLLEAVPPLSAEELQLIPKAEMLEVNVAATERGLLLRNGRYEQSLAPGSYRYWQNSEVRTTAQLVDMRRRNLTLNAQELMTRDKVSLRVTVSAEYCVADERQVMQHLADGEATVYQAAQLALRDYISGLTLDALLEARAELARYLDQSVAPKLSAVGLQLLSIGVKDVVLPGEMKALLNRVIEAEKEAAANVILRREEVAATRSLANTARVMAEQPILLRLKELDALRDIAERIAEVRVVVGAEGLATLLPTQLLTGPGQNK